MTRAAILQPNYLPWKGVFDLIRQVDIFVFLEDVQYTEHDWRNRNLILTKDGTKWITVPVLHSGRPGQQICQAEIDLRMNWQRKHYNAFVTNYAKAPFFKHYHPLLEELYLKQKWQKIADFNKYATERIAAILGLTTRFISSLEIPSSGHKDDKIIQLCQALSVDAYLSGPSARAYINPLKFAQNSILLEYMQYEYPEYPQLFLPFNHRVTVLDLLFNCGPKASYYIWGWRQTTAKE